MARAIIDVHSHIGRTVSSDIGQTVEESMVLMSQSGIGQAIISVAAGGLATGGIEDTRRANDGIAVAVAANPMLFPLGLASVEVRHGATGVAEVGRAFDELGLRGLAFHTVFEGFSVDSAAFDAVLAATGDRRGLVLLHSNPDAMSNPRAIATVAVRYPNLTFVMGHPVFTDAQRSEAIEAVLHTANVHLDIAYQADPALTEFFVREVGASRVFFGSDSPFFPPADVIQSIEDADISDADRDRIFAGNAQAVIDSL